MKKIGLTLLVAIGLMIVMFGTSLLIVTYPLALGIPFVVIVIIFTSYVVVDVYLN